MADSELPVATLVHAMAGRARLRFAASSVDSAFLDRSARRLGECPGVVEVRVNARTGGILILFRGELAPILDCAEQAGLFHVHRKALLQPMHRIEAALSELDGRLAEQTRGALSLGAGSFIALVAASAYQGARGRFLPAGLTLLTYAIEVMHTEAGRELQGLHTRPTNVS